MIESRDLKTVCNITLVQSVRALKFRHCFIHHLVWLYGIVDAILSFYLLWLIIFPKPRLSILLYSNPDQIIENFMAESGELAV